MNYPDSSVTQQDESNNNLRAIFEILSYLQLDAKRGGHDELAERLGFAMTHAENKLADAKSAQTVAPVTMNV